MPLSLGLSPPFTISCDCPEISQVYSTRYLGVEVDQCLKWDQHMGKLVASLRKLVYDWREVRDVLSTEAIRMLNFAPAQPLIM